ncbi:MAG: response regulator transcription factor [Bdellovibrionales bacterium]|nr:response regulator transcription factor [Bdellovibrionales bacterium]
MKILIAEDDHTSALFLQHILAQFGCCDVIHDGEAALELLKQAIAEDAPYDLLCLDIMMPKLDGQRVLQALRAEEKQRGVPADEATKIIMISALDDSSSILNSFELGCEVYMTKPFDKRKLIEHIRELGLIET